MTRLAARLGLAAERYRALRHSGATPDFVARPAAAPAARRFPFPRPALALAATAVLALGAVLLVGPRALPHRSAPPSSTPAAPLTSAAPTPNVPPDAPPPPAPPTPDAPTPVAPPAGPAPSTPVAPSAGPAPSTPVAPPADAGVPAPDTPATATTGSPRGRTPGLRPAATRAALDALRREARALGHPAAPRAPAGLAFHLPRRPDRAAPSAASDASRDGDD